MNEEQTKLLLHWLNDAYAMEKSIVDTLKNHAGDAKDNPTVSSLIEKHLAETEGHAEMVKSTIERLGGDVSEMKTAGSRFMGMLKELPMAVAKDELVKNALEEFATEHFEIASYTSLMAAGEMIGDEELVSMCKQIISEEEAMAQALSESLPTITKAELTKLA
jgi:ferritin-like metal-binding protein YciE